MVDAWYKCTGMSVTGQNPNRRLYWQYRHQAYAEAIPETGLLLGGQRMVEGIREVQEQGRGRSVDRTTMPERQPIV